MLEGRRERNTIGPDQLDLPLIAHVPQVGEEAGLVVLRPDVEKICPIGWAPNGEHLGGRLDMHDAMGSGAGHATKDAANFYRQLLQTEVGEHNPPLQYREVRMMGIDKVDYIELDAILEPEMRRYLACRRHTGRGNVQTNKAALGKRQAEQEEVVTVAGPEFDQVTRIAKMAFHETGHCF